MRIKGKPTLRLLGNVLIGVGLLLIVGVGGAYAYSLYMEQQVRADPWLAQVQAAWDETPTPTLAAEPVTVVPLATETAPTATPALRPTSTPTPTPRPFAPPVGIRIPSVDVDSRVLEVGMVDGEFEVPPFYVGHFKSTSAPGAPGNGVYTGHVESLNKGQVFANLRSVKTGEEILLYTVEGVSRYRISQIKTVPNDDLSVMEPTADSRITLITCTGSFDWATHQYTHRFIVVATLVEAVVPERAGAR